MRDTGQADTPDPKLNAEFYGQDSDTQNSD